MMKDNTDTYRWTNDDINISLAQLRELIRVGAIHVALNAKPGEGYNMRDVVAHALGIDPDAFNTQNFKPKTLLRFAQLLGTEKLLNPTQDQIAWALTNFINRRKDPWEHVRPDEVSTSNESAFSTEAQNA